MADRATSLGAPWRSGTSGPRSPCRTWAAPGSAHLGVPRSGALDAPAHRLANRLVGNDESAATLECLGGQLTLPHPDGGDDRGHRCPRPGHRRGARAGLGQRGVGAGGVAGGAGRGDRGAPGLPGRLGRDRGGARPGLAVDRPAVRARPGAGLRRGRAAGRVSPSARPCPVEARAHDPALPRAEAAARVRARTGSRPTRWRRWPARRTSWAASPTASGCASRASRSAGGGRSSCRARGWSWAASRCRPTGSR